MKLSLDTDRTLISSRGGSVRYLRIRGTAPAAEARASRAPLDIAFVVDRSGSMSGGKLELAVEAIRRGLLLLNEGDFVTLVAYDTSVECLVTGARLDPAHRARIEYALASLAPRASTNLSGGWLVGCEEVAKSARAEGLARVLVMSDGRANAGIVDATQLEAHARELAARGVVTSTFGIGADFDEVIMEALARGGAGNFYYIAHSEQIAEFVASELGEALEVVARNVVVELALPDAVAIESLEGRTIHRARGGATIPLGDLVSRQSVEIVLALHFPPGREGSAVSVGARVWEGPGVPASESVTARWEFAAQAAVDGQARNADVDRVVARRYAARVRQEAVELNRVGEFREAQRVVLATAQRIQGYAGDDPEMLGLIRDLVRLQAEHGRRMSNTRSKEERFASYTVREGKSSMGRRNRAE